MAVNHIGRLGRIAIIGMLLSACNGDPNESKLPDDGRLTKSEAATIKDKLGSIDQQVFQRWSDRMNKGEAFGGEGIARTVRQALLNQLTYETQEAESAAKAEIIAKRQRDNESAERARVESILAHRQAVNSEIRKYIDATIPTYRPQTFYDRNDQVSGGLIEFNLKLRNRGTRAAIGIAGLVTIRDVFGNDLGSYPFALEPRIGAGQTIDYRATLNFDPRNPQHQALWRAKNITSQWFFESAAFDDGTRIDEQSVRLPSTTATPTTAVAKQPNT